MVVTRLFSKSLSRQNFPLIGMTKMKKIKKVILVTSIFALLGSAQSIAGHANPSYALLSKSSSVDQLIDSMNEYEKANELAHRRNMPTGKQIAEAIALYKAAAKKGNVFAMHNLGVHYANGDGVDKDLVEAFKWYMLAAKMGFAGSQNNLGDLYEKGPIGVKKSTELAVYWYTQAAMAGEPTAYLSLGTILIHSQPVEALFWLKVAIAHLPSGLNLADARKIHDEYISTLTSEEVEEVTFRAKHFKPLYQTKITIQDRGA